MFSLPQQEEKRLELANTFIILAITLLGTFLRFQYLQKSDFVINDGGMFYTMILDLERNNYLLPMFTSYNQSQIPFAYPPLSFYEGAFINQFLHVDLITIFRWYPLIFNILSIPAVYFLSMEIVRKTKQAIISTGFYAILLPGFEWLISGGGLTRSPAHTFFIISFTLYLAFLRTREKKHLIFSIFTGALMTLHHIEYCWMLVFSSVLFSFYKWKIKENLGPLLLFFFGIGILTAPYWVVILLKHGPEPFLSAFSAGEFNFLSTFARLTILVFTEETLIAFINVLAIIGLLYCLFTKNFIIVIWLVLIGFLNPRSANRSLIFPVVILASIAIDELICPALDNLRTSQVENSEKKSKIKLFTKADPKLYSHLFILFAFGFPFFLGFINTLGIHPVLSMLPQQELEALQWIRDNTDKNGVFVVLNPSIEWHMDKLGEWFPALTNRKSLTTIQGTEWLPDSTFEKEKIIYDEFKECAKTGETCLAEWELKNHNKFDYLVVSRVNGSMNSQDIGLKFFIKTVEESEKYDCIYINDVINIYKKKEN